MKKALIFEGKLIQIESESFPVVPAMIWIDVEDDVTMETHTFNGADIVTIPKQTPEERQALLAPLSPAQVRLVLNQFGLLTQVETAIAAGSRELQIEWEFRIEFKRDNVLLNSMATGLGLTDVQLDNMFKVGILL